MSTWIEMCEERQRLRMLAKRYLGRDVLKALNKWMDSVAEQKRIGRFMRRALNSSLTFAFLQWQAHLGHLNRLRRFGSDSRRAVSRWRGGLGWPFATKGGVLTSCSCVSRTVDACGR